MSNDELEKLGKCQNCRGTDQKIVSDLPEGRINEVYRVECSCGAKPDAWSVSRLAAIRRWNAAFTEK